jgi:creatinine amidohydrolase
MNLNLLFVKNERNEVTKAWCQYRGESFWVTKTN